RSTLASFFLLPLLGPAPFPQPCQPILARQPQFLAHFAGPFFTQSPPLSHGHAGGQISGDLYHWLTIKPIHYQWPFGYTDTQDRSQWHHVPLGIPHLELLDLGGIDKHLATTLHDDLPGAAELVEIVDVKRAHVDLKSFKNVVLPYPPFLALLT